MAKSPDVVIVGGGVIGLALAHRLAGEGRAVTLYEAGSLGREATWAAGGILHAIHPWRYPSSLATLLESSVERWERYAQEIVSEGGVDIEYRKTGLLMIFDARYRADDGMGLEEVLDWNRGRSRDVVALSPEEIHRIEPSLGEGLQGAILHPDVAQVRNSRLARSLASAATRRGANIVVDTPVEGLVEQEDRITGVRVAGEDLPAGAVIVASGAWSSHLLEPELAARYRVEPVKGQMLLLEDPSHPLERMVLRGAHYLIPRNDGSILVGSTVEHGAGFDRRPTVEAIAELSRVAIDLIPSLERATFCGAWAGLRPYAEGPLPLLGPVPDREGLWLATGHFRNGIGLAPITAEAIVDSMVGRTPRVDLRPFAPTLEGRSLTVEQG